jgi:hypothetical protein
MNNQDMIDAIDGVYKSGRFNKLGDELVVVEAYSDWGQKGHMVSVQFMHGGRPARTPKMFFTDRNAALNSVMHDEYMGFGPSQQAVDHAAWQVRTFGPDLARRLSEEK